MPPGPVLSEAGTPGLKAALLHLRCGIWQKLHTHFKTNCLLTPSLALSLKNHPQFTSEPYPLSQNIFGDCLQQKKGSVYTSTIFLQENKTANYKDLKKTANDGDVITSGSFPGHPSKEREPALRAEGKQPSLQHVHLAGEKI